VKFLSLATYLEMSGEVDGFKNMLLIIYSQDYIHNLMEFCEQLSKVVVKKPNDIPFWTAGIYFLFRNFNFTSQKNRFISKYSYDEKFM